jgi:hypothetical protein
MFDLRQPATAVGLKVSNRNRRSGWVPVFFPVHATGPLNTIWGWAKYYYRLNPPSTKEEDVERYATAALAAVTIDKM